MVASSLWTRRILRELGATLHRYLSATSTWGHIISSTHNTNRSRNDLFARNAQATNVERLPDGRKDGRMDGQTAKVIKVIQMSAQFIKINNKQKKRADRQTDERGV